VLTTAILHNKMKNENNSIWGVLYNVKKSVFREKAQYHE
jgi:hypothetical protein